MACSFLTLEERLSEHSECYIAREGRGLPVQIFRICLSGLNIERSIRIISFNI